MLETHQLELLTTEQLQGLIAELSPILRVDREYPVFGNSRVRKIPLSLLHNRDRIDISALNLDVITVSSRLPLLSNRLAFAWKSTRKKTELDWVDEHTLSSTASQPLTERGRIVWMRLYQAALVFQYANNLIALASNKWVEHPPEPP